MAASNQRLGDNPRDHDGVFHGIPEGLSDVMGLRPEATGSYEPIKEQFKPWRDDILVRLHLTGIGQQTRPLYPQEAPPLPM